jgi:hypothetical protein
LFEFLASLSLYAYPTESPIGTEDGGGMPEEEARPESNKERESRSIEEELTRNMKAATDTEDSPPVRGRQAPKIQNL